jgi:hypothetical protein
MKLSMDLYKTIKDLQEEERRLDVLISMLEGMLARPSSAAAPKRRGRKSMGEAERREVSRRMKTYWDARKKRRS